MFLCTDRDNNLFLSPPHFSFLTLPRVLFHPCLGYFRDDFISHFVGSRQVPKKPPIINRGYFGRVECINATLQGFRKHIGMSTVYQILNIGGGYDTLAFQVLSDMNDTQRVDNGSGETPPLVRIFEVDFPEVIQHKARTILSKPDLRDVLLPPTSIPEEIRNASYSSFKIPHGSKVGPLHLLSCDLREADSVVSALLSSSFDPSMPTIIISECVLVYMSRRDVGCLVKGISDITKNNSLWVSYDMINPSDSFGKVMVQNLAAAGHRVPGLMEYPSLESQQQRFLENGWNTAISETFLQSYNTMISAEQKRRISKLEIFDELEEWSLLMSHYSLTIATNGDLMSNIYPNLKAPHVNVSEPAVRIPISSGWGTTST